MNAARTQNREYMLCPCGGENEIRTQTQLAAEKRKNMHQTFQKEYDVQSGVASSTIQRSYFKSFLLVSSQKPHSLVFTRHLCRNSVPEFFRERLS